MLLSVPHVLSRIASQKLFQKIDLHFGRLLFVLVSDATNDSLHCKAADKSESQRSADILTRIILDPDFAIHVKGIRIFVPAEREHAHSFAFQLGAHRVEPLRGMLLT